MPSVSRGCPWLRRPWLVLCFVLQLGRDARAKSKAQARQTCAESSIQQFKLAATNHQQGALGDAGSLYEQLLWMPGVPAQVAKQASNNLAAIQYGKGETDSAIRWWKHALGHDANNPSAHLNIALAYESKGEVVDALRHARLASKLKPNNAPAEHLIGNLQQTLGNMKDAHTHWKVAGVIKPSSSQTAPEPICEKLLALANDLQWEDGRVSKVETASTQPKIITIADLLPDGSAEIILQMARSKMEKSWSAGDTNQKDANAHRNSSTAWLRLGAHEGLVAFTNSLAKQIGVTPQALRDSAEDLQVVRYEDQGYFKAHHDGYGSLARPCTMLFYLTEPDTYAGGETWFPFAVAAEGTGTEQASAQDDAATDAPGDARGWFGTIKGFFFGETAQGSEPPKPGADRTAKVEVSDEEILRAIELGEKTKTPHADGLAYKGSVGSAVVFANAKRSRGRGASEPDPRSVHAGLPVTRGEKWVCNLWFRS